MATNIKAKAKSAAKIRKLPANTMKWMSLFVFVVAAGTVGSYMALQGHAATCYDYSYKINASGTCVKYIQQLANYQIYPRLSADGSFGSLTQAGIKSVQKSNGLAQDGIVGPHTWNALCNPKFYQIPNVVTFTNVAHSAGCKIYTSTGPHAN